MIYNSALFDSQLKNKREIENMRELKTYILPGRSCRAHKAYVSEDVAVAVTDKQNNGIISC